VSEPALDMGELPLNHPKRVRARAGWTTKARLMEFVIVNDAGCWIWQGARSVDGYGFMKVARKMDRAHRVSYREHVGPIPDGMCVCHRCDVRLCCNPEHLFLGTNNENMADMARKGRAASGADHWCHQRPERVRGERNPRAKLTVPDVVKIRAAMAAGGSPAAIGRLYGVTGTTISSIASGKLWRHV